VLALLVLAGLAFRPGCSIGGRCRRICHPLVLVLAGRDWAVARAQAGCATPLGRLSAAAKGITGGCCSVAWAASLGFTASR
jgi:hypothetical protein